MRRVSSRSRRSSPRAADHDDSSTAGGGGGGRGARRRRQEEEQEEDEEQDELADSTAPCSFSRRRPLTQGGDYVGLSRVYGLLAGLALVGVRLLGAAVNPVADCDETYNYWEPVHYLAFGSGLQTWEYSPEYTLRSYAYLLPHAALAKAMALALGLLQRPPIDKTLVFYGVRATLGLLSAACEATFVDGVTRRMGPRPGALTFLLLFTSAGVFQASTAMLPSSAAACLVMLAHASWMTRRYWWATLWAVVAVLGLGWPFVALLFVPLALHVLAESVAAANGDVVAGALRVAAMGLTAGALVLPPVLAVDYYFYRRLAFPALNILLYNVGGGAEGADDTLYGVEPWSFYLKNLLLNFNVALPLALLLPPALAALPWPHWSLRAKREALLFTSPAFLWLAVMTSRPHKEERFLFPIYPLLCLAAALTVHGVVISLVEVAASVAKQQRGSNKSSNTKPGQPHPPSPLLVAAGAACGAAARLLGPAVIGLHLLLGASRAASMAQNFAAPLDLFAGFARAQQALRRAELVKAAVSLHQHQHHEDASSTGEADGAHGGGSGGGTTTPSQRPPRLLCMGGEWYRFPSSFFLPHDGVRPAFVRSHFRAQLPQFFRPGNGTWAPPLQPFNQHNREEPSRYVPIHSCTYLMELFPPLPHAPPSAAAREGAGDGGAEEEEAAILRNQRWVDDRLHELGEARPVAWTVLQHHPLLDKDSSPSPYRAFWVPFLSRRRVHYGAFALLEREQEDNFDPGVYSELGFIQ